MALCALCALYTLIIYIPFVNKVAGCRKASLTSGGTAGNASMPGASVIVYAQGEADRLEELLPTILGQDYGGLMEVIVVNEGDSADVRSLINMMQIKHRNVYLTFTPEGAHNLSRKKLGLTLGIKAARYEVVVLTTADAIIESREWLAKMMRHFENPQTEIVLGFAAPLQTERLGKRSAFCFANESADWIAPAGFRHPFRGTELNLAYRKELFFENKGFSRSFNLLFGDDDIFISEIANGKNTKVELSPEAIVRFGSYNISRTLRNMALRYRFTARFLHKFRWPVTFTGEMSFLFSVICCAMTIALDWKNTLACTATGGLVIAEFIATALSWRKACRAMGLRKIFISAPFLVLWQPFWRLYIALYAKLVRQKHYTWE